MARYSLSKAGWIQKKRRDSERCNSPAAARCPSTKDAPKGKGETWNGEINRMQQDVPWQRHTGYRGKGETRKGETVVSVAGCSKMFFGSERLDKSRVMLSPVTSSTSLFYSKENVDAPYKLQTNKQYLHV